MRTFTYVRWPGLSFRRRFDLHSTGRFLGLFAYYGFLILVVFRRTEPLRFASGRKAYPLFLLRALGKRYLQLKSVNRRIELCLSHFFILRVSKIPASVIVFTKGDRRRQKLLKGEGGVILLKLLIHYIHI